MSLVAWALLIKPALTSAAFILAGLLVFLALWAARRRDAAAGRKTRGLGVVVAGLSCLAMGGLFAFIFAFYALTV
jgi:predicted small integral membrane protein